MTGESGDRGFVDVRGLLNHLTQEDRHHGLDCCFGPAASPRVWTLPSF
jgi:hypothetical protein